VEEATRDKNVIIVSIPEIRDGIIPELEQSGIDSLWVQQQLGIPVVKVFNSITAESITALGRPKGDKDRITLAVSGDNTIAQSWKQQPGSSIYCRDLKLEELKKRVLAMGDDWSAQRDAITTKHSGGRTRHATSRHAGPYHRRN
jgi:hypothetical protein